MKKRKGFIIYIFVIFFIFITTSLCVYADEKLEQLVIDGMNGVNSTADVPTDSGIATVINIVIGGLQYAGSGISLIVIAMLGIKYMLAGAEEKAEIKKRAMPIVIGCVILFATTNIVVIVNDIVASIN